MARNILNNGTVANDGTGDSLRDAIDKINNNFVELYNKLGGRTSGDYLAPDISLDSTSVVFEDSNGVNSVSLRPQSLTANRNLLLPDASGTLLVNQDNQTISNPLLFGAILDSNQNELMTFNSVVGAVNSISTTNSIAATDPQLTVEGDDADINIAISAKGIGKIKLNSGLILGSVTLTGASDPVDLEKPLNIFNRGTAVASALSSGTLTGQSILLVNIGAGDVTVTPTALLNGTSFTIPQNGYAEVLWVGSSWLLQYDPASALTITP